jgi:tRNA pseudouridine55 synthase
MDGLLIIDKPVGPTSHDVVVRVRRALHERRIGHTGTLDPIASGVLPLVVGKATRLARFLEQDRKVYEAVIRLGIATDTYDAQGERIGERHAGPLPSRDTIERTLERFRGTFLQQPPAFSAKKIGGQRSYALARAASERVRAASTAPDASGLAQPSASMVVPALPAPVRVTADAIDLVHCDGGEMSLRIECSGGFYVRALAHDLGQALAVGAHLVALRRTEASGATVSAALPLDALEDKERGMARAIDALIPLPAMLGQLPRLTLTTDGLARVAHGGSVSPAHVAGGLSPTLFHAPNVAPSRVRLLSAAGHLVAVAEWRSETSLLRPVVVLM